MVGLTVMHLSATQMSLSEFAVIPDRVRGSATGLACTLL